MTHPVSASNAVVTRYKDAYRIATFLVSLGDTLKVIGAVAGFIILLLLSSSRSNPFSSGGPNWPGIVAGVVIGGFFFILGILVAAQGQILRATLDTAVSSSHFLTDSERAIAMGLSTPAPGSAAGTPNPV